MNIRAAGLASRPDLRAALVAGTIAILSNTALLVGADAIHFTTARGGLLRLIKNRAGDAASSMGIGTWWTEVVLPATAGPTFQSGFHIVVGLLMAIFYAYVIEPRLTGKPWQKGVLYSVLVWFLNACVVLPALGEGIAGSRYLPLSGMVGFIVIHTVFFVLLGILYARFRKA
jgi:hypothetical protein